MQVYTTDWLGAPMTFYNEKSGKVSTNIHEVIDYDNLELHPEGIQNFLDYGFSVFGQTPVKHVKYLRHSSRLTAGDDSTFQITELDDPADAWLGQRRTSENEAVDYLEAWVQDWEKRVEGEFIIPTSGGYDSRLLNWLIKDKSRIRSFTFGISRNQAHSFEVVYARKLSELLGTRWQQIELGDFNRYLDDWYAMYGAACHAHGMYQIDFYRKMQQYMPAGAALLSGTRGGSFCKYAKIHYNGDIEQLRAVHAPLYGLHADRNQCVLASKYELRQTYWERMRHKLVDDDWCALERLRGTESYMSYLKHVPEMAGYRVYAPFREIEVALRFLTIAPERRTNRIWQQEYFRRQGIELESMNLHADKRYSLNRNSALSHRFTPLNVQLLREIVKPSYVEWINRQLIGKPFVQRLLGIRKVGGVLRRLAVKETMQPAYHAYLTLYPLQKLLERRGRA